MPAAPLPPALERNVKIMEIRMSLRRWELRAEVLVLGSLAEELKGGACVQRSDNQAAVQIIQAGRVECDISGRHFS